MIRYDAVRQRLEEACADLGGRLSVRRPGLCSIFRHWRTEVFPFAASFEVACSKEALVNDVAADFDFHLFRLPDGRLRWTHDLTWAEGLGLPNGDFFDYLADEPPGADRDGWVAAQVAAAAAFVESSADVVEAALDFGGLGGCLPALGGGPEPRLRRGRWRGRFR
jgi:hypothetical protein